MTDKIKSLEDLIVAAKELIKLHKKANKGVVNKTLEMKYEMIADELVRKFEESTDITIYPNFDQENDPIGNVLEDILDKLTNKSRAKSPQSKFLSKEMPPDALKYSPSKFHLLQFGIHKRLFEEVGEEALLDSIGMVNYMLNILPWSGRCYQPKNFKAKENIKDFLESSIDIQGV